MEQRLQKIISASGLCSRRRAEELIAAGRVNVNGKVAVIGDKAIEGKDKIVVDGKELKSQRKVYYVLNKPKEVVVAKHDPQGRKTVFDLPSVRKINENLMHVGRLDYMSEGLLILTSDGDFANLVMHPRYEKDKTYYVKIEPAIKEWDLAKMRRGMWVDDVKMSPARVRTLSSKELEITIHEGMNRIIRRMMEILGYKVFALKRTRIGIIGIGRLKLGETRALTESEVASLSRLPEVIREEKKDRK